MTIVFKRVRLHNFMSFEDAELDLNEMGNILVTGRNYCKLDNAYSNGSGKSSIFNGICFALTGETSQGISNGIENIFSNPNDCWVELEFEADGDLFKIKRMKTPRPDMKIYINGEDKSGKGIRESSRLLATYLPDLTSELISSAIILGQGLPYRFSNNSPSLRKELLEKLTKSDFMIQSIKDKLELRQSDLRSNLREKEDSLIGNTSQVKVYTEQLERINDNLNSSDYSSEEDLDSKISELEIALSDLTEIVIGKTNDIEYVESIIADLHKDKSVIVLSNKEETDNALKEIDEEIRQNVSDVTDNKYKVNALKKEIKELDSITDICPTCGQKIPDVTIIDTTDKKEELSVLETVGKELSSKSKELESKRGEIVSAYSDKLKEDLDSLEFNIEAQTNHLSELKDSLSAANLEIQQATQKLFKYKNTKENFDRLTKEKSDIENKLSELDVIDTELTASIVNIKAHLDVVQQELTLAKREFRGILLSNTIEFINKKVKQYSLAVFGTTELNFALNENCIDITYNDKMYENMSGGEKQKIDIIIQLALRDILSKQLNIHTNILILDEIYDNLDSISCQKITNLVSTLTDISSIFIISHHAQDLEITYDSNLLVEKNEFGISHISFV